jgi:hypothetical protein
MSSVGSLDRASLSDAERRTLERFVRLLEYGLRDDLVAVWLYGSRARGGVCASFREAFVAPGGFDPELAAAAARALPIRELGDYEARPPSEEEARRVVGDAERFVTAVAEMLGDG